MSIWSSQDQFAANEDEHGDGHGREIDVARTSMSDMAIRICISQTDGPALDERVYLTMSEASRLGALLTSLSGDTP